MHRICLLLVPFVLAAGAPVAELLRQAELHIQHERFAEAEPLLDQALRQDRMNVQVLYRLAYVQYRQRKLAEARTHFEAVVRAAPPAHNSRYFLGRIALQENKPLEAIDWLEPVMASGESIFDAASQLAGAYVSAGQHGKAAPALRAAIAAAPWDAALYYRLGQVYRQLGEKELSAEALENSRRLRNANREDVETLMQTSQAIGAGKRAEALQIGERILKRDGADPNALVALGVIYGSAGMQKEALQAFELAAGRDANLFQAQFNIGLALLKVGRTADALYPLSRSVELLPQSLEANLTYGLASVMSRNYADAVSPLERAWQMDPSSIRIGALLATSYLRTGAAAKAVRILRDISPLADADPAPLLLLVEALNAAEDPEGALDAAQLARKRFPTVPQAHMAAAQQLARVGRYQDARPAFLETLRLVPGHPEAELGLADTLQKAGAHAEAVDHFRLAINAPTTSLAARLGMARSLIALRQLDSAREILEQGLTSHPEEIALRLELSRVYLRLGKSELAGEQTRMIEKLRAQQAVP
ncbi:MAG: tetratricopeptide repeat protein [Bryobacteraceae bacterium]